MGNCRWHGTLQNSPAGYFRKCQLVAPVGLRSGLSVDAESILIVIKMEEFNE